MDFWGREKRRGVEEKAVETEKRGLALSAGMSHDERQMPERKSGRESEPRKGEEWFMFLFYELIDRASLGK